MFCLEIYRDLNIIIKVLLFKTTFRNLKKTFDLYDFSVKKIYLQ